MRFFRASAEHGTQSLPIVYTIGSDGRVWLQAVLVLAPSSSGGFSDLLTSAILAFVSLQTARSRLWRGQHCTLELWRPRGWRPCIICRASAQLRTGPRK